MVSQGQEQAGHGDFPWQGSRQIKPKLGSDFGGSAFPQSPKPRAKVPVPRCAGRWEQSWDLNLDQDGSGIEPGWEWDRTGVGVGWERDGTEMEQGWNWDGTGMGVGWNWDGRGIEPGWEWDGSGMELGWNRDRTPMGAGQEQDGTGMELG